MNIIAITAIISLSAIAIVIVVYILKSKQRYGIRCKSNESCLSDQTCDLDHGICVSLPGYACRQNSDCSHYAPYCQVPQEALGAAVCLNLPSAKLGTAGNPPTAKGNCDSGLELNTRVNLCQNPTIGAHCVIDAACGLGLCSKTTSTCQYSTHFCSLDVAMNASQCTPGLVCDPDSLRCTIPGSTPGSDGNPCQDNGDCVPGSTCIKGPAGSSWTGICESGGLSWLTQLTSSIEEASKSSNCMRPLAADRTTSWCRYDIGSSVFMSCDDDPLECQYPYTECSTATKICVIPSGNVDPIVTEGFVFIDMGISDPGSGNPNASGNFYRASYPGDLLPQFDGGGVDDVGGRLTTPYYGFLAKGEQFKNAPGLYNRGLVISFSAITSFCITPVSSVGLPPPYYTVIAQEPTPIIISVSIIPNSDPQFANLYLTYYRENFTFNPPLPLNGFLMDVTPGLNMTTNTTFLWNPSQVSFYNTGSSATLVSSVPFIANPIVTVGADAIARGESYKPYLTDFHHVLLISNGNYYLNVSAQYAYNLFPYFNLITLTYDGLTAKLNPRVFLITGWDAITLYFTNQSKISTVAVFYGLDVNTGEFQCRYMQLSQYNQGQHTDVVETFAATTPAPFTANQNIFYRLSRAGQSDEPLLLLTVFSISAEGLVLSTFSINSLLANPTTFNFNLDAVNPCSSTYVQNGVSVLKYVSPVSGMLTRGAFTVWCSTSNCQDAYLVMKTDAICVNYSGSQSLSRFWSSPVHSAVYWCGQNSQPYTLYPVGGADTPYFLATDRVLTFDGTPNLAA